MFLKSGILVSLHLTLSTPLLPALYYHQHHHHHGYLLLLTCWSRPAEQRSI